MSEIADALRRLHRRIERPIDPTLAADQDKRIEQLLSELRRGRPDTWPADLAGIMAEVA